MQPVITGERRDDDVVEEELGFAEHLAFGALAGYCCAVVLAALGHWLLATRVLLLGVAVLPMLTYLPHLIGPRREPGATRR